MIIGQNDPKNCIQPSCVQNLDIIGSNVNLSGLEVETATNPNRAFLLKEILKEKDKDLFNKYENIFIDCPPSLSLLTVMSLVVADQLLVPLQTEFFALEGISQLVKTIERIKINLNPNLEIRGILLTMFDKRNKLSNQVDEEARNILKKKFIRLSYQEMLDYQKHHHTVFLASSTIGHVLVVNPT